MTREEYAQAVATLAKWHRESDQAPLAIWSFPDPALGEVRLIEVTRTVPETGELYPIVLGPTTEMPCRTVVAQVTESEWDAILAGAIPLPAGWNLSARVAA